MTRSPFRVRSLLIRTSFLALALAFVLTLATGPGESDPIDYGIAVSSFYLGCLVVLGLATCKEASRPRWVGTALGAGAYLVSAGGVYDPCSDPSSGPAVGNAASVLLGLFVGGLAVAGLAGVWAGRWLVARPRVDPGRDG